MQLKKAEKRFKLTTNDYAQLAGFRHALRGFMRFSEEAASEAGLTSKHYQAMLVLRACPDDRRISINDLARQLFIRHNSAVGLVDRLGRERLMVREPSRLDRRKVYLRLTSHGRQVLAKLAAVHQRELHRIGPGLQRFFAEMPQLDHPGGNPSSAGDEDGRGPSRARSKR